VRYRHQRRDQAAPLRPRQRRHDLPLVFRPSRRPRVLRHPHPAPLPGLHPLPGLESWQETQEPSNLREHFGDIIKDDAPKRISGDYNIVELRAVLTSVDRVTNALTGIDWLKCEADCRFPLTIALLATDDVHFYMAGSTGSWYKPSRFSVVP